ncbi:MAG: PQ-loop repeat-containing protein [bacterium]
MNLNLFFPWIAQIIFFSSILPQIRLNFKLKSTKGVSDFLILGYFYAYTLYIFYAYCLNLPLAHKVMVPLSLVLVFIMIFQRFYFSDKKDYALKLSFLLSIVFFLSLIPVALKNSYIVGHISGWIMISIWATYQIPQVFKNYSRRSVHGLSFSLLSITAFGDFTEFLVALYLGLPPQTYLSNFRGLCVYLIFVFQFLKFRTEDNRSQDRYFSA